MLLDKADTWRLRIYRFDYGGLERLAMMKKIKLILLFAWLILAGGLSALPWPIWPDSNWHVVSATYGHIKGMTRGVYLHNAIDIRRYNIVLDKYGRETILN